MSEAYFYHLTSHTLEATLPMLLGKARGAGWRVAVLGTSAERLDWLDEKLWAGEGFMPHGRAGTGFDADQPILLCEADPSNAPDCLVSIDGADIAPDQVKSHARTMILFDGNSGDAVALARKQWKALTDAGCAAKYWSQDSGRWEMKAEHNPES